MHNKIRWGLLATGAIARVFADGVKTSQTGELVAVGSRSLETARAFGAKHGIATCYGSYEELLADRNVEAVYISTPHPQHALWAIQAAAAGKHVLMEKPAGINQYELQAMLKAAAANQVFFMEAYMYRCHPQTAKLVELLRAKTIGDVRVIQATFSFFAGFHAEGRIWNKALGGGAILDVGGYTTSVARLVAGAAQGLPFADPIAVSGAGHLHPQAGVDAWAVATLRFPGDIVATLATGVGVIQENVLRIFGSEGHILVPDPFVATHAGAVPGMLVVNRTNEAPREIRVDSPVTSFTLEVDVCGRAIRANRLQPDAPAMTWADSLGNLRTQDAWRAAIGLTYADEKIEDLALT